MNVTYDITKIHKSVYTVYLYYHYTKYNEYRHAHEY